MQHNVYTPLGVKPIYCYTVIKGAQGNGNRDVKKSASKPTTGLTMSGICCLWDNVVHHRMDYVWCYSCVFPFVFTFWTPSMLMDIEVGIRNEKKITFKWWYVGYENKREPAMVVGEWMTSWKWSSSDENDLFISPVLLFTSPKTAIFLFCCCCCCCKYQAGIVVHVKVQV